MAKSVAPRLIWQNPSPSQSNMDKFRRRANAKRRLSMKDFKDLHAWSTDPRTAPDFWIDLYDFMGLTKDTIPKIAIVRQESSMFPPPQFFPEVRMNFAEHLLHNPSINPFALHAVTEGAATIQSFTRQELSDQVRALADAMHRQGVRRGDRVAAVISNCVESIIACLATLSLGALWSTTAPDMGEDGIMQRLDQIEPKIVFFESSVQYNGKLRSLTQKYKDCLARLRRVRNFQLAVLIIRDEPYSCSASGDNTTYEQFLTTGTGRPLIFEQLPFNHPGFIVYSSGTTGAPKCIVHSACGLLLQVKKDYVLHLDVQPGDTVYQYTTTGWIMWAIVLCGLSFGGTLVLYDGSPLYPDPLVTLRLVEKLKITLFGTSARFLTDLQERQLCPKKSINLSSLRTVSSTGSVLPARVCEWFYDSGFPDRVHLVSASGGTDLACSLVGGDPTSPLYSGEIQVPALGMAVDILDSSKDFPVSVKNTGTPGELVCRQPFPSQPVKFWGLGGREKYQKAYFERFGNDVWTQGDFVSSSSSTGGYTMLGRSDGVLNPSGVRFGSAEIYQAIDTFHEFEDTICVGRRRPQDSDESVMLFVKMRDSKTLTQPLIAAVRSAIASSLSPRHVPKYIFQAPEIPYTTNGKKIELAVKQIVSGAKITPSGAVMNPESLPYFERFADDSYLESYQGQRKSRL